MIEGYDLRSKRMYRAFDENNFNTLNFDMSVGPKKFNYKGHNYFYSGHIPELAAKRVDWLEARNICRGNFKRFTWNKLTIIINFY